MNKDINVNKQETQNNVVNNTDSNNVVNNTSNNVTNNNTNNVNNIEKQINYNYGISEFEKEKKQCKVLLMLLNNFDFRNLREQALNILNINPDNSLATMIYLCGFKSTRLAEFSFLEFEEEPLLEYVKEHKGVIDLDTSMVFLAMLMHRSEEHEHTTHIMNAIFANLDSIGLNPQIKAKAYDAILDSLCNKEILQKLRETSSLNMLENFDEVVFARDVLKLRSTMANTFIAKIKNSDLAVADKNKLLNKIYSSRLATNTGNTAHTTSSQSSSSSTTQASTTSNTTSPKSWLKGLMWGGIIAFIMFIFLIIFISASAITIIGAVISLIVAIVCGIKSRK